MLIRTVFGTMAVLVGSIVAVAVVRNFMGVVIGTGCVLADRSWSTLDDKWIGVGAMNKKTRAIDEETYKLIIATMKNGFAHEGVQYKPNERIATVLVLEYNLGLRVGDILQLRVDSFVKDGSRYRLCGTWLCTMPDVAFYDLWCVLLPPWGKNRKLGELRLRSKVLIRTGLGTMAVLAGSVVVAVILRNYLGVVIGT